MNAPDQTSAAVIGFDHLQLLCPPGGENQARVYWGDLIGLAEVPKPPQLAGRGGVWFRCGEHGLHVGAEPDFVPATRAHPAIRLADVAAYDALASRLQQAGYPVDHAAEPIAERRMKSRDPFGNMVEFLVGTTG